MHGAILSSVKAKKSLKVINYLIAVSPQSIDLPSRSYALTPLALAFVKGRLDAAQALIKGGANQTTRDALGRNLVHLAIVHMTKTEPTDTGKFKALLALIDKRLLRSLFTERCSNEPGSLTPLAYWLSHTIGGPAINHYYGRKNNELTNGLNPEILSLMLEFGGSEALYVMDGK